MNGFAKSIIMGNCAADGELRTNQTTGELNCKFRIAVNQSWKKKDGTWGEHCDWHDCIVFGDERAQRAAKQVIKGRTLVVEGVPTFRLNPKHEMEGGPKYFYSIKVQKIAPPTKPPEFTEF